MRLLIPLKAHFSGKMQAINRKILGFFLF